LTLADIQSAKDDEELFQRLSSALTERSPPEAQEDRDKFYATLLAAPRGLRAMAGTYDLDVSLALDDLAWHFGNHNDERFLQETVTSLRELEADEAAALFAAAWDIVRPFLSEIRDKDWNAEDFHDYLDRTGIQTSFDPLNEEMWAICKACGEHGLI
jgi:AcrR family transcriptional regulator